MGAQTSQNDGDIDWAHWEAVARRFVDDGVVVLPAPFPNLQDDTEQEMHHAPEFSHPIHWNRMRPTECVQTGGTAFASSPSVFHNKASRQFEQDATKNLWPFLSCVVKVLCEKYGGKFYLARINNRFQIRRAQTGPGKESWHYDFPPKLVPNDSEAFHFWIGCYVTGKTTQYLSLLKGTHGKAFTGAGFHKVPVGDMKELDARLKAQGKIEVPPNHYVLFFSDCLHKVDDTKALIELFKHFLSYCVTRGQGSVFFAPSGDRFLTFEEMDNYHKQQGVLPLPSGQIPTIIPRMYCTIQKQFNTIFVPWRDACLVPGAMRCSDAEILAHPTAINRSMRPLSEIPGARMHVKYTDAELAKMRPSDEITVVTDITTGAFIKLPLYPPVLYPIEVF